MEMAKPRRWSSHLLKQAKPVTRKVRNTERSYKEVTYLGVPKR